MTDPAWSPKQISTLQNLSKSAELWSSCLLKPGEYFQQCHRGFCVLVAPEEQGFHQERCWCAQQGVPEAPSAPQAASASPESSPHLPLVALKTEVCLGLGTELVSQQIFGLNLNHFESSLCSPGFGGVGCTEFWCGWAQCVWGEEAKCSPRNPALLSDPLRDNLTGEQDPKMSQRP